MGCSHLKEDLSWIRWIGRMLMIFGLGILPLWAGGKGQLKYKSHVFDLEIASTLEEKAQGMMFRKKAPAGKAMFFVYDEDGYHPIWMKNCIVSLDVAWVDAQGKVVWIEENVPPCPVIVEDCPNYGADAMARHFVEFAPGTFKRIGLKKGDRLSWEFKTDQGKSYRTEKK